jgi:hypothetical protein
MREDIRKVSILLAFVFAILCVQSCNKDDNPVSSGDCPNGRSGAVCNDGTSSSATGSGACSSHGGVKNWICK